MDNLRYQSDKLFALSRTLERELAAMTAERDALKQYCGSQPLRSDFRTADELRKAYDTLRARVAELESQFEPAKLEATK